jgi:hypothetical protein
MNPKSKTPTKEEELKKKIKRLEKTEVSGEEFALKKCEINMIGAEAELKGELEFLNNLNLDGIKMGSNQSYKRIVERIKQIEKELGVGK